MALVFLGWVGKGRLWKKNISCNAEVDEWCNEGLNEVKCYFTIDFSGSSIAVHMPGRACDQELTALDLFGAQFTQSAGLIYS